MKPKTKCMMWVRPSYRIYTYNLDIGEQYYSPLASYVNNSNSERGRHPGALTFGERLHYKWSSDRASRQSETRCNQSSSNQDCISSSLSRNIRATSNTSNRPSHDFGGHTGYYAQQLANSRGTNITKATASARSETESSQISDHYTSLMSAHHQSLREGRLSSSRAVRRAEQHANASGKDPRHVPVPRDTSDDICKKVADLRMTPIEGRDFDSYRESTVRGRYRVNKLERELNEMISSNMSYKSYSKSAKEMAKEAHEAAESESKSSRGYKKTTLIETSKKRA